MEMEEEIEKCIDSYMKNMFLGISEDDLKVFEKVILQMTENTGR